MHGTIRYSPESNRSLLTTSRESKKKSTLAMWWLDSKNALGIGGWEPVGSWKPAEKVAVFDYTCRNYMGYCFMLNIGGWWFSRSYDCRARGLNRKSFNNKRYDEVKSADEKLQIKTPVFVMMLGTIWGQICQIQNADFFILLRSCVKYIIGTDTQK